MLKEIVVYSPVILLYAIPFTVFIVGVLLIHSINKEEKENEEKEANRKIFAELSKASITENAVPARKVFNTLKDAGIKPNFLGKVNEQG